MNCDYERMLMDRFLRYVAVNTQSDGSADHVPSTPGQLELARMLADELKSLGLVQIHVDEHAIVTAVLPATVQNAPRIGFVAHLDTVDVALSPDAHPQILRFDGSDVCLNTEKNIWLRVAEHPELLPYTDQDIIFTDGTSVLGADNKAAIANIMSALEILTSSKAPHGEIRVAFVPDEEVGLWGSKLLDLDRFDVDFAYTIDCCAVGELVHETFNAGTVTFEIDGVTAHPMSAKNVLVNPLLVASDIISCFDRAQTPEHTEGKEGYWWFVGMEANAAHATLRMQIRDFNRERYEERKNYVANVVDFIRVRHPGAKISWKAEDVYANIGNALGEGDQYPVTLMYDAAKALNITPHTIAMRGGTDGSALSWRGLVTPNYFTGALNFHSHAEFLPIPSFRKSLDMTLKIIELAAASK